jgi:hypothetical protein
MNSKTKKLEIILICEMIAGRFICSHINRPGNHSERKLEFRDTSQIVDKKINSIHFSI